MWPWPWPRFEWGPLIRALRPVRFRDFFSQLPQDRPFCVLSLARLSSVSEDGVRRELQAMASRLEAREAQCCTCEQSRITYRIVA
jgi:hypothetical protein